MDPLLNQVASYKHQEVILRFMDEYDLSEEETKDIFEEMKKLLCLMAKYPDEYIFTHEPLWIIDEMWHTFLMYSKDYEDFCLKYFDRMIYHQPIARAQKMAIINDLKVKKEETEAKLKPVVKNLYSLIYDYLGQDTLVKWIKVYAEKYTLSYMDSVRKPIA